MELNVRDWLIILGSLVAAGFVLDAYRRVRAGYSDKLRMSAKASSDDDDELSNPELPGGGARVVARKKAVPSYEKPDDGDNPVPVLMDSVEEGPEPSEPKPAPLAKPELDLDDEIESPRARAEKSLGELAKPVVAETPRETQPLVEPVPEPAEIEPEVKVEKKAEKKVEVKKPDTKKSEAKKAENAKRGDSAGKTQAPKNPEEIIVLHVVAHKGEVIPGATLLQILLACDVRYGEMDIFHRYEEAGGAGAEQFSVVNMVAPGTFDPDAMEQFSTPGVTFFMRLPGPKDAIKAFDCMVETAQVLVKNLHCELQDEARSVCTTQTLEHLRQRIRDFERRQLTLV